VPFIYVFHYVSFGLVQVINPTDHKSIYTYMNYGNGKERLVKKMNYLMLRKLKMEIKKKCDMHDTMRQVLAIALVSECAVARVIKIIDGEGRREYGSRG